MHLVPHYTTGGRYHQHKFKFVMKRAFRFKAPDKFWDRSSTCGIYYLISDMKQDGGMDLVLTLDFWNLINKTAIFLPDVALHFSYKSYKKSQSNAFLNWKKLWLFKMNILANWWNLEWNQPNFLNLQWIMGQVNFEAFLEILQKT